MKSAEWESPFSSNYPSSSWSLTSSQPLNPCTATRTVSTFCQPWTLISSSLLSPDIQRYRRGRKPDHQQDGTSLRLTFCCSNKILTRLALFEFMPVIQMQSIQHCELFPSFYNKVTEHSQYWWLRHKTWVDTRVTLGSLQLLEWTTSPTHWRPMALLLLKGKLIVTWVGKKKQLHLRCILFIWILCARLDQQQQIKKSV